MKIYHHNDLRETNQSHSVWSDAPINERGYGDSYNAALLHYKSILSNRIDFLSHILGEFHSESTVPTLVDFSGKPI